MVICRLSIGLGAGAPATATQGEGGDADIMLLQLLLIFFVCAIVCFLCFMITIFVVIAGPSVSSAFTDSSSYLTGFF